MAAVLAESQAKDFTMLRETCTVNDEIDRRALLGTLPEADGIVDEINAGTALGDAVGANHFVQMDANFGRGIGDGQADNGGVLFEAAPVALIGESFAAGDAQGGEDAPAADKPGLAGRQPHLLDGQKALVMEDVGVNHLRSLGLAAEIIL